MHSETCEETTESSGCISHTEAEFSRKIRHRRGHTDTTSSLCFEVSRFLLRFRTQKKPLAFCWETWTPSSADTQLSQVRQISWHQPICGILPSLHSPGLDLVHRLMHSIWSSVFVFTLHSFRVQCSQFIWS